MKNTYDLFTGKDLEIAELIQQRRLQLLIHSRIYYELNDNLISDKKWDEWARELKALQEQYPNLSKNVRYYEVFKGWDASTGAFLPLNDPWVVKKASQMVTKRQIKKSIPTTKKKKRKLF